MEPEIRYTTATDGVSIAYYTMGEGHPLVVTSSVLWSHLRLQPFWEYHRSRSGQGLGRGLQVVRYDARGTGLSDRHPLDFSMDARLRDLEAVVERLKLTRFAVFGWRNAAPAAIAYAARHPECVSHLVLVQGYARGRDQREISRDWESLRDSADERWDRYTLTMANVSYGFSDSEAARKLASLFREAMTPEAVRAFYAAQEAIDVTPLLLRVAVPTLVMHRPGSGNPAGLEWSREIASKIPDARFVTTTAQGDLAWTDEQTRIVEDFLGVERQQPAPIRPDALSDATTRMAAAGEKSFSSGRYVVRRVLGEGGQKIVYLVHDTALDRECALSVIKRDLLEPDDLLRLQREAQSMARLGASSTVVTVFDIGEDDGTPYIVCEYVPGGDLSHELRTVGTLSLDRALAIATDVAEALVIAHAHGVVHRDIKPSNVWICENGSAKLGDFGLAFSLDRSRLTMPGTFLGTASYMPPEQALGRPAEPRSDLYSLGAILYEMVTGAPPFAADDTLSVISQHVNVTPVPPIAHNPDLPPALDALILRLLAKSPEDRPASASEVAGELRSVRQTAAHMS